MLTSSSRKNFRRSLKLAAINLWRNKFLTVATIAVMGLILFIFNIIVTLNLLSTGVIQEMYKEVDMILYMQYEADIFTINTLVEELSALEETITVTYTTKEGALQEYLDLYPDQEDPFSTYGITNPLPANIKITTSSPEHHGEVQTVLDKDAYSNLFLTMESNSENQNLIDKVLGIGSYTKNLVMAVLLTFVVASFLVILNAIYLTVFSRRKEIEIMKLVGAEISFIRWPFIIEGVTMSTTAVILSFILIYGFVSSVHLETTILDLTSIDKLVTVVILQIILSIGVGTLSSFIAIQNNLNRAKRS